RDAVRTTWASPNAIADTKVKCIFLLGLTDNDTVQQHILEEDQKYHDILQVNFKDDYFNLTLKTWSALQWKYRYCNSVPWMVKADDDIFIQPWLLSQHLKSRKDSDLVCRIMKNASVCRTNTSCNYQKWAVSYNMYPNNKYP
ncbi:unnamed protein product, partial [Meganyctiphanes norvegica]